VSVLGDNSAGDQCAADGENMAAGGVSATTVQRQCVRVGAADVVVLRRSVVARSAVDVGKNMLKLVDCRWDSAGARRGLDGYNGCSRTIASREGPNIY
jgi:hypothetical protein